jgi:hypothetical protein
MLSPMLLPGARVEFETILELRDTDDSADLEIASGKAMSTACV